MTGSRDTRPANWAKTVKVLRRKADDLRKVGWTDLTCEPEDLEIPPHLRIAKPSADMQ